MNGDVAIEVYRRLDNRMRGESDDSPFAWELHRARGAALHDVLDRSPRAWHVRDWGKTDDEECTHELVQVVLQLLSSVDISSVATPALAWLGGVMSATLSDSAVDAMKALVGRLSRKQEEGQLLDVHVRKDGRLMFSMYPPGESGSGYFQVPLADGGTATVQWNVDRDNLPRISNKGR